MNNPKPAAVLAVSCPYLMLFWLTVFFSPVCTDAQGLINGYAKVTGISGKTISLSNVNQTYHSFAAGEQIILMQMQDTVIGSDTAHNASFGTISNIANAGKFEILTIATINQVAGVPVSFVVNSNPANTYNTGVKSTVQVISFNLLSAGNYTTTSNITGLAWNGTVGGVVAFQVGGTLTLANSVIADGLGFNGGAVSANYEVSCEPNVYDTTSSNYAYKGEGIYASPTINYTNHNGRAPLITGGGGGSDDNGGGGGGGNFSAGGQGGQGWTCTTANASGGLGGVVLASYITSFRVFMGGGGGGGQQNNSVGTPGGKGGGIIMIKANTLSASCSGSVQISAAGISGGTSGNDGAGGAGAGGTIVLQFSNFSVPATCPLTVQANGGNGGNVGNTNSHGGGGGGGQGAVMYSASLPTNNITTTTTSGSGGLNSSSSGATSAGGGGGTSNAGILTGVGTLLPVNFISFTAGKSGSASLLHWVATKALQPVIFNIQRSVDGAVFLNIGKVDAIIDGGGEGSYIFTDNDPAAGRNIYRIEEIDLAGQATYSTVAEVDFNGYQNSFSIYPNPSGGPFTIRLTEEITQPVSLTINDLAGKTILQGIFSPSGKLVHVNPASSIARGLYIVRIEGPNGPQSGKLLIR